MNYIFDGSVKDNKLFVDKSEQFKQHLVSLNGKRVQVTVEKIRRKRTPDQNAWYWGVAVKMIAQETGHEPDEIHDALKHEFCPKVLIGNLVAAQSTKRLDTIEFGDNMMEKVVRWAAETLHMVIPMPPPKEELRKVAE